MRLQFGATVGLPVGLQASVQVPVDVKVVESAWFLGDTAFQPTWEGHDHADGAAVGLGDIQAMFGIVDSPPGAAGLILGAHGGVSLATGAAPQDPASRAAVNTRQREFGTGTFDPSVRLMLFYLAKNKVGLFATGSATVPVYATAEGYQGAAVFSGSVGPTLRLPEPVKMFQLRLLLEGTVTTQERWHGQELPNSGRGHVALRFGLTWNATPKLALSLGLQTRVWEDVTGDQFTFPVTGTLGVTGFVGPPKKKQVGSGTAD